MKHWPSLIAVVCGSLGLHSQVDSTVQQLQEIEVVDYKIKTNQTFKERLLATDSLPEAGPQSLGEALRDHTGIFVKSYGGNGVATLSLRGTGASHTRVFWNQLDIGSPMLGLADLSTLPLQAFDQLSIQYGFASLSGGSGALGGSLRMNSRPDFENSLQLVQTAGSFGRYQSSLSIDLGHGQWHSQTRVYATTAKNNFKYPDITESGQPEKRMQHSDFNQKGALQNIYYRLSPNELLSLKTWYSQIERQLPPPITGNQARHDELSDNSLAAVGTYQREEKKWSLLLNTGIHRAENIFTNGIDSSRNNNAYTSWQNNLRHHWQLTPKLEIENGMSYRYDKADSPNYGPQLAQRHHSSIFSHWSYDFSKKWGSRLQLRQELIDQQASPLIGSLGLFYMLTERSKLRVNAAHNYRYPTLNDFYWLPGGNPSLKPEKSWSYEAGYRLVLKKESFNQTLGVTAFYNLVDNWIQWVPTGSYTSPENLKKVENAGLELSANGKIKWGKFSIGNQLSYAYTRSFTTEVYGQGQKAGQLPYVPFHKIAMDLAVQHGPWLLHYQQTYTSRYYTTSANQVYMPGYAPASISIRHQDLLDSEQHQLSGAFSVNNLYDLPYQVLPYRPEPGIFFNVQLRYNLGL